MTGIEKGINAFLGGLIVVAVVAVMVKPSAITPQVLNSTGGALSSSLSAAEGNG